MSSPETEEDGPDRKLPTLGLIGALVAAGLFGGLWLTSRSTTPGDVDRALAAEAPEVRATAEEVIELLLNLDANNVEETGERVLDLSTGNFREDYEELLPSLAPAFEESGARATGEILEGPDVTFSSSEEAVAVAQVAQTTSGETERTIAFALRLTLVLEGEAWRADGFELLGEL
jgi:hypothetical protein